MMDAKTPLAERGENEDRGLEIDVRAVNSKQARQLYKKREQIYPKIPNGRFRRVKWAAMAVMLAIYYVTPWIRWDRGLGRPDQAALVDFEHRRFYFFFIELWPQEVYYFAGLLILASFALFLFTSLFGRVWCGYACPQTVWTDLYIMVERLVEGDRSARIRLDKAPLNASKAGKKILKHVLWIVIAAATGGAWVFYFADAPTLFREIFTGQASTTIYLFIGLLTFTTYALAGTMREQVCTYMCPWPRIQAAMIDQDALSVTYRIDRGEPRGAHKKGTSWDGRGDCIDCKQCVAVCPQGIDIRDGSQLECINCALCIDACDDIMEKVGRPIGLIAYDTDKNVARRAKGEPTGWRFVRPRTVLYSVLMLITAGIMTHQLIHRATLELNVVRDRAPPFVRMADGSVRNNYAIKILNKEPAPRRIEISVQGADGLSIAAFGEANEDALHVAVTAQPDAVSTLRLSVTKAQVEGDGAARLTFIAKDPATGVIAKHPAAFVWEEQK